METGIIGTVETITPEQAQELLERNRCGRRIDPDVVRLMARGMRRGRWDPRIQALPIQLDDDGYLVSGQTLLSALVEAGTTLELVFRSRL